MKKKGRCYFCGVSVKSRMVKIDEFTKGYSCKRCKKKRGLKYA